VQGILKLNEWAGLLGTLSLNPVKCRLHLQVPVGQGPRNAPDDWKHLQNKVIHSSKNTYIRWETDDGGILTWSTTKVSPADSVVEIAIAAVFRRVYEIIRDPSVHDLLQRGEADVFLVNLPRHRNLFT